ncbi:hypothetical protein PRSY57_1144200 [Plasmodium reichenowi]|uniref:DNA-directed RNA polymerase III subunit RPC3 n=1 Tax=Plasmodium reichenowi TaxID=5854 RepID=A0A151LCT0_PLARE|nr:hypothetical protein PRSY57_1144200 [Plasmodium reichenowi]KYN96794.1 hypothetical protein PRSY57_1144200 [Plasmodium reichenowi]
MIKNELDYLKYIICDMFGSCCSDIIEIILLYGNKLSIYELINLSSYEFNVVRNVLLCLLIHNIVDVNIIYSKSIECNHLSPEETIGVINVDDNNKISQDNHNEMNQHSNNKIPQHSNNKIPQHSDNKIKYLFKDGIKKKNIISHHKHNEEIKTIPDIQNEEMQSFNFLCNSKNYEYMKRCKCDSCICKIRRVEYFVIIKNIYVLVRYPSILYYIHPTCIIKDKKSITSLNNFSTTSSDLQLDMNTYNFFNTEMIDEFEDLINWYDDKNGDIMKNNNNNNNNHNNNTYNDDYLHNRNQIQDDTFFRNSNGLVEKNETLNFIKKIILIRIIKNGRMTINKCIENLNNDDYAEVCKKDVPELNKNYLRFLFLELLKKKFIKKCKYFNEHECENDKRQKYDVMKNEVRKNDNYKKMYTNNLKDNSNDIHLEQNDPIDETSLLLYKHTNKNNNNNDIIINKNNNNDDIIINKNNNNNDIIINKNNNNDDIINNKNNNNHDIIINKNNNNNDIIINKNNNNNDIINNNNICCNNNVTNSEKPIHYNPYNDIYPNDYPHTTKKKYNKNIINNKKKKHTTIDEIYDNTDISKNNLKKRKIDDDIIITEQENYMPNNIDEQQKRREVIKQLHNEDINIKMNKSIKTYNEYNINGIYKNNHNDNLLKLIDNKYTYFQVDNDTLSIIYLKQECFNFITHFFNLNEVSKCIFYVLLTNVKFYYSQEQNDYKDTCLFLSFEYIEKCVISKLKRNKNIFVDKHMVLQNLNALIKLPDQLIQIKCNQVITYAADFHNIKNIYKKKIISSVLENMTGLEALRIWKYLLINSEEKINDELISEHVLIPLNDVRKKLYHLLYHGYIKAHEYNNSNNNKTYIKHSLSFSTDFHFTSYKVKENLFTIAKNIYIRKFLENNEINTLHNKSNICINETQDHNKKKKITLTSKEYAVDYLEMALINMDKLIFIFSS